MAENTGSHTLGIDIGTTKVAAAILHSDTREVLATASLPHASDVPGLVAGRSEQNVTQILDCLDACVAGLPEHLRQRVETIGVTGQMHGVVLWNSLTARRSHLITWQDQRCLEGDFLSRLRAATGDPTIQSGYGAATLSWLAAHEPETLMSYSAAATVHDYVVTLLTGNARPYTDPSDAASFGFYDLATQRWREDRIKQAGIPTTIFATIRQSGECVGTISSVYAERWRIPERARVTNALGDNQASLYGSLTEPLRQIALTIGTGAQASVVVSGLPIDSTKSVTRCEFRPYIGDSYIAVAASLSGGRVLARLAHALHDFMKDVGIESPPSLDAIHSAMHHQGLERCATDLRANASLSGERYDLTLRGSLSNLSFDNFSVGDITAAFCRGLVISLRDSLPLEHLAGRSEVVGSGNAIARSPLMQRIIKEIFGCTLTLQDKAETTACGAALLAADLCG